MYQSTKTFTPGFSCAFRQWKATSHCRFIHGYALEIKLTFGADELDERNWVQDFGGFDHLKAVFKEQFDHTTIVAIDDPEKELFTRMSRAGLIDLRVMDHVGCEAFARWVFKTTAEWLPSAPRVWLVAAEVREHSSNSAIVVAP
jgi:6-pyruvoyltetrahydropterin/6-carboxytetrahydropterin synthase